MFAICCVKTALIVFGVLSVIGLFKKNSFFIIEQIKNVWSIKGAVMQIEKALINDRLRVSKVSWKFCIPTIYNFAVIYS